MEKTLVFDFDGSLADSWPVILDLFNNFAEEHGFNTISDEEVLQFKKMNTRELLKAYKVPIWKALRLKKLGGELLLQRVDEIKIFDGMTKLLKQLKSEGYRLGVLTFNFKEVVDAVIAREGWDMFDFVYCVPGISSKNRSFKKMLKHQKIDKTQMIYIGDEIRDIELAKHFDVKVISVAWGYNTREILEKHEPDGLVSSTSELLNEIRHIFA